LSRIQEIINGTILSDDLFLTTNWVKKTIDVKHSYGEINCRLVFGHGPYPGWIFKFPKTWVIHDEGPSPNLTAKA
jgi:hypothetical protein